MMKAPGIIALLFLSWTVWLFVSQYLLCVRYQFNDPIPFEGSAIYNPYDSMDVAQWKKCNFHAHSRAWEGLTNGHGTAEQIHDAYKELKYEVHCVSNYHHIDTTFASGPSYIAAYEHGYNISKTHQLVLGGKQVKWLDYLFPQSTHNKQHVLDDLEDPGQVIILNHPALKNGYTPEDLSLLSGYDCMEVLSPSVISTKQWDAALSSGKKVFIVGDDDIHDVLAKKRLGEMCTFVNVPENTSPQVLQALKKGKSYGVVVGAGQVLDSLPQLTSFTVNGDTISIKMSHAAEEVALIGQNGKILASAIHSDTLRYTLSPRDRYARATFKYANGTGIYLNPVFYMPESGYKTSLVYEDVGQTTFFRMLGVTVLILWMLLIWTFLPGNRQRFNRNRLLLR